MSREQRITLRVKQPNPLFEQWMEEWLNYAEQKDSMKKHVLRKALESLRKYPLVLHSGRDCAILEGFGSTICQMIDKQLIAHNTKSSQPIQTEAEHNASVQEVIKEVQQKLNQKKKNIPKSRDKDKQTTEDMLNDSNIEIFASVDLTNLEQLPTTSSNVVNPVIFERNSFEIILLVDSCETIGKSKQKLDTTIQALKKRKVNFEVRELSAGDFLWIARDQNGNEAVLPYIVERKRMDDLASSIKDGRFREQKFRLKESGISNVIYLIEYRGNSDHLGLPIDNLLQAATNTQIQNQFSVKFTDSHDDSMIYLSVLTEIVKDKFKDKNLIITKRSDLLKTSLSNLTSESVMSYFEFNEECEKNISFTVKEMFLRQLLDIQYLTLDKAIGIVEMYPTPRSLFDAYAKCQVNSDEAEFLLANIKYGKSRKSIGPQISKILYNFFNNTQPS